MTLARILLPLGPDGAPAGCGESAFGLAARFGARVEGFYPDLPAIDRVRFFDNGAAPFYLKGLIEEVEKQARTDRETAEKAFTTLAGRHPAVASAFVALQEDVVAGMAARGRVADIVVAPAVQEEEGEFWWNVRESALFDTGRPALICPREVDNPAKLGETVVVAWKNGLEASRAVAAARRLLAEATTVRVISVGASDNEPAARSLRDIEDYLMLLGFAVQADLIDPGEGDVARILMQEAAREEGGLLVMGAYSHWRWREWAFGGVTEHVMHEATVPVLMVH